MTEIDSDPLTGGDDEAGRLYAVAFHPERDRAVVGGHGRIWMWDGERDTAGLELLWESDDGEPPAVRAVAFDAATGLAATADDCGVIRLWDTDERTQIGGDEAGECGTNVDALAFGDGTLIAGDGAGAVLSYDVDAVTGAISEPQDAELPFDHTANVRGVDVDPSGTIASASGDESVQVLLPDGKRLRFEGHSDSVGAVATSGPYVVSGANDGTARLWWLPPSPPIGEILPPSDRCATLVGCFALGVGVDSTGGTVVTTGSDGLVHVWLDLLSPDAACDLAEPLITAGQLEAELGDVPRVCFVDG